MLRLAPAALALLVVPMIASSQSPAAAPGSTVPAKGASPDRIKCHSSTEIGSLAKVVKECHTVAEWRRIAEANRSGARDMVDRSAAAGIGPQ